MMMGFRFVGALFMLIFWGGLIVLAVWVAREMFGNRHGNDAGGQTSPTEILARRYARGEISREEYELALSDLMRPQTR